MTGRARLALGYDTERPYGAWADRPEAAALRRVELGCAGRLAALATELDAPLTFFVLGQFLERCLDDHSRDALRQRFRAGDPRIDLQQHSQTHQVIRPIPGRGDKQLLTAAEFGADVGRAGEVLTDVLGVRPAGLRTPLGYDRDLGDRPDVLAAVAARGIRWVSSHCRGGPLGLCPELSLARQPSTYAGAGWPGLVEVPSHGWQDVIFTREHALRETGAAPLGGAAAVAHYLALCGRAAALAAERGRRVDLCLVMHPWCVAEWDPDLAHHRRLVEGARALGLELVAYADVARAAAA